MNLTTEEGRKRAIKDIESSLMQGFRDAKIEIAYDAIGVIDGSKITIGIARRSDAKVSNVRIAFASEVEIYAEYSNSIYEQENSINFPSSGQFDPSVRECYWRTIHAASILKNWDVACKIVNQHCEMYRELIKEIEKQNKQS